MSAPSLLLFFSYLFFSNSYLRSLLFLQKVGQISGSSCKGPRACYPSSQQLQSHGKGGCKCQRLGWAQKLGEEIHVNRKIIIIQRLNFPQYKRLLSLTSSGSSS